MRPNRERFDRRLLPITASTEREPVVAVIDKLGVETPPAQSRYWDALDVNRHGVIIIGSDYRVIHLNSTAEELGTRRADPARLIGEPVDAHR